jgi:uncharacterized phiE125 gp8 family phage protein
MRQYTVTVAPAVEPVTVSEVKRYLRVDFGEDDEDISDFITAARQWLERKTGKALITQTVRLVATLTDELVHAPISGIIGFGSDLAVELTPAPAQSVTTVEIETSTNQWQTLVADTEWQLDNPSPDAPAYIALADWTLGYWTGTFTGIGVFPIERRGPRLRVTYIAGYGDAASDVPMNLREAVKMGAAHLYDCHNCPLPDSILPSDYIPYRL